MELAELVGLRPVPCAGLLLTLTQRCPLRCAHCSSASTMSGVEPQAGHLAALVGSFGPQDRPDVLMMTGGEPMLRPGLVAALAASARRVGTRSAVLTGAFFAVRETVPARILPAIRAVDHFSVSVDVFHEREVPRAAVFRLLRTVMDVGIPVSVHAVGSGPDDPYLAGLTAQTRRVFGGNVPMLVNTVRSVGRAAAWASARPAAPEPGQVLPCAMAAWPVVAHDGVVLACCNQDVVDRRPAPEHLALGHVRSDDWPTIRGRALSSPTLRMIRAAGPLYLLDHYAARAATAGSAAGADAGESGGAGIADGPGYCQSCRGLAGRPEVMEALGRFAGGPGGELLDQRAARVQFDAGPVAFVRRYGCAPYAELVGPGQRATDRRR